MTPPGSRSPSQPAPQEVSHGAAPAGDLVEAWHRNRRWVAAVLLTHKPREADLEELLQEVALRVVREGGTLREPAAFKGWLRQVAMNIAITAGRRQTVRRKAHKRLAAEHSTHDSTPSETDLAASALEEGRRAMAAAEQLPEAYREPLLLRAVRGMSYRQISEILDIPITTVETRLARARRMLREQLQETTPPSPTNNTPSGNKQ